MNIKASVTWDTSQIKMTAKKNREAIKSTHVSEEVQLSEAWQLSSSYSVHFMMERGRITFFQVQMRVRTKSTERWAEDWVMSGF